MNKKILFSFNSYIFFKLPTAWWSGVRFTKIDDSVSEVSVKHRWVNQNPFGSMFWAIQGMAAELSTAVFLMLFIRQSKKNISMLVLNNKAKFSKKAKGLIKFECNQRTEAMKAINSAVDTGEAVTVLLKSVGKDKDGDKVSEFEFEWSLKIKN